MKTNKQTNKLHGVHFLDYLHKENKFSVWKAGPKKRTMTQPETSQTSKTENFATFWDPDNTSVGIPHMEFDVPLLFKIVPIMDVHSGLNWTSPRCSKFLQQWTSIKDLRDRRTDVYGTFNRRPKNGFKVNYKSDIF